MCLQSSSDGIYEMREGIRHVRGVRSFIRKSWESFINAREVRLSYRTCPDVHEDALSCTRFVQLVDIVHQAQLNDTLGLYNQRKPSGLPALETLNDLRRDVAHYHLLVHTMRDGSRGRGHETNGRHVISTRSID